jgi:crotonobetainyl-CoA:carnitine CoA-transferase CaiB-like acyl-CoA transferase
MTVAGDDGSAAQCLAGFTVLELGDGVAAAFCGKLLADYGATVLKIEPPAGGDSARQAGPFPPSGPDREASALYLYLNTNKQSVTLDLEQAAGQKLALRLAQQTDLVVENLPTGYLDARGLGYAAVHALKPSAVYVSLSAWGRTGPRAQWLETNLVSFATGGQMQLTGDPDREPLKSGGEQAEYQLGLNGFSAALAGIWDALETGDGQLIEISAQEVMASTLEVALNTYAYTGMDVWGERRGNILAGTMGIFPCIDGDLGIHAMPRNFPPLTEVMQMPELASDERFNSPAARLANNDELIALMFAWASGQEKHEVYRRSGTMRGPVAFVHDMADLFESPQLAARGGLREVEHPVAGRITLPGPPFQMSETPARAGRAPLLGEQTDAVLRDRLGLSAEELRALAGQGVIS